MARAKSLVADARSRRIARFTDQLSLFVQQRCMESNVNLVRVDDFITILFGKMVRSREELGVLDLLKILTSDDCREEFFSSYRDFLIEAEG